MNSEPPLVTGFVPLGPEMQEEIRQIVKKKRAAEAKDKAAIDEALAEAAKVVQTGDRRTRRAWARNMKRPWESKAGEPKDGTLTQVASTMKPEEAIKEMIAEVNKNSNPEGVEYFALGGYWFYRDGRIFVDGGDELPKGTPGWLAAKGWLRAQMQPPAAPSPEQPAPPTAASASTGPAPV
jgi:hypothetical protein